MSRNSKVVFLGNESSFHLRQWLDIYQANSVVPEAIYSVHEPMSLGLRSVKTFFLNKYLSYILLGFRSRFIKNVTVHAHGASGYGLAAMISGKKYIVTVYGSEIFGRHNFLYRYMMKCVLMRAAAVTVTSDVGKKRVDEIVIGGQRCIYSFHTGINTKKIDSYNKPEEVDGLSLDADFILSLRNTGTQYRTEDIISSYLVSNIHAAHEHLLVVVLGNGCSVYFNHLKEKYGATGVRFIDKRLCNEEMCALIERSRYCINFPITDQLSSSILEALYLGSRVVTCDLPAYAELYESGASDMLSVVEERCSLSGVLSRISASGDTSKVSTRKAQAFIEAEYSNRKASSVLKELLERVNYE